jgi:hypothetical protein
VRTRTTTFEAWAGEFWPADVQTVVETQLNQVVVHSIFRRLGDERLLEGVL